MIEDNIKTKNLIEFDARQINSDLIKELDSDKTFIDLIMQESNEQIYTNILFSLLSDGGLFIPFCRKFKKPEDDFLENEKFAVFREETIVGGRIDICAESPSQRVVIENKINGGLNGIKPASSETQLNKYYEWAAEKENPLCFIIVPDSRQSEIFEEIKRYDERRKTSIKMRDVFQIVTYGAITEFIEEQKVLIPESYPYSGLISEIGKAFIKLSKLTKEDLYVRLFLDATK